MNGLSAEARKRVFGDYVPGYAAPVSLTEKLGLESINFASLSSQLSPGSHAELDKVLSYLNENPNAKILIEGHTDANKSYDQALSEARADEAKLYLAMNGIDPSRVETIGYAGTKPIVEGTSSEARAANRRIEIQLSN
ncbi:MAG: OmpA family protein [Verrucomicrobiales bacterium]|nr:OmpA family protein [Verrucomicrobiales bacterium]